MPFADVLAMQDLRTALRGILRHPGFSIVAVLTIALGIGANTAIFSVADAVLLRPLPYRDPQALVHVSERGVDSGARNFSFPDYVDFRRARTLDKMALFKTDTMVLGGSTTPRQITIAMVTGEFFAVLGAEPTIGRGLTPEEDRRDGPYVVVLGARLWREAFAGDVGVIGRTVLLDTRPYTVVGIAPPNLDFPESADVWLPLGRFFVDANSRTAHSAGRMVARLAPGATRAAAQAELDAIARAIDAEHRATTRDIIAGAVVRPLQEELAGTARPALFILLGAVGLVLLIACANVANLVMVRSSARRRELALRAAIGASRWRLVRQLLVENLVIAAIAGVVGVLSASWATDLLVSLGGRGLPAFADIGMSGRVLAFASVVSLLTGLAFGLLPALQASRVDPGEGLKESERGVTPPRAVRLRRIFVAAQAALAVVLLVGAGLLLESFRRVIAVAPGFEPDKVFTAKIALPGAKYNKPELVRGFTDALASRLDDIPGVTAAALVDIPPLSDNYNQMGTTIAGEPPRDHYASYDVTAVSPGYFRAMSIPIVSGRAFAATDRADAPLVAMVDQAMARRFPGEVVGGRLRVGSDTRPWIEVIGVVGDVRQTSLELAPAPHIYLPLSQRPAWNLSIVVRSGLPAATLQTAVEGAVHAVDPGQPVYEPTTMDQILGDSVARRRFSTIILAAFAAAALLLSALGIYGVVAFSTSMRTHEIAIRMALGAHRGDVVRMVVRQGMVPVAAGAAAGAVAALAAGKAMAGLLYEVRPVEPLLLVAVALLFGSVAALAAWLPARRAARVPPMAALRAE